MKYTKALFIYNGNAGKDEIGKLLEISLPKLAESMEQLLVFKSIRPGHAKALCEQYGEEVELVIVLGGDGTVHECINGIAPLKKRPVFAILPGGTCNDFTRTLGMSQNLAFATEELVNGLEVSVDIVQADHDYFLNFWGVGLVTETSNNIKEEEKNLLGRISYFLSALRTMKTINPFDIHLTVDGKEISEKAVMVLIVNGNYIGGRMLPIPSISYDDGLVDIFLLKNTNLQLLREIMDLRQEQATEAIKEEILYFRAKNIKIKAENPIDIDMDGEVYQTTPSEITVLSQHIKMIKPRYANK